MRYYRKGLVAPKATAPVAAASADEGPVKWTLSRNGCVYGRLDKDEVVFTDAKQQKVFADLVAKVRNGGYTTEAKQAVTNWLRLQPQVVAQSAALGFEVTCFSAYFSPERGFQFMLAPPKEEKKRVLW